MCLVSWVVGSTAWSGQAIRYSAVFGTRPANRASFPARLGYADRPARAADWPSHAARIERRRGHDHAGRDPHDQPRALLIVEGINAQRAVGAACA